MKVHPSTDKLALIDLSRIGCAPGIRNARVYIHF